MPQFQTWVEIPITVFYTLNPEEKMTWTYPGTKASITIDDIEVADDVKEWIEKKYEEAFEEEAWDNEEFPHAKLFNI